MSTKVISIIFLCVILVVVQAIGNEPSIQKSYYVSSTHETWFDALANCRMIGMKLLEIESTEKNKQLQEGFKKRTYGTSTVNGFQILNYWTAGNNVDREKSWKWKVSEKDIKFTAWAPGQPDNNNYYGDEYCIELLYFTNTDLFWNDSNCLIKKQYICESL